MISAECGTVSHTAIPRDTVMILFPARKRIEDEMGIGNDHDQTNVRALREALARRSHTDAADWFPVFKARYGLSEVMRLLADRATTTGDDTVITQLFTCCTAVVPIVDAGMHVRYADINADTLSIDVHALHDRLKDGHVAAVMLQHTFGMISPDADLQIANHTKQAGALLIEDSAHCVTRMARSDNGLPLADISLHSFGVEKMLPTRFGGAVWINPKLAEHDDEFNRTLRSALSALPALPSALDRVTRMYINQNRVFSRLGSLGNALRSSCTRHGWYEPPIADSERAGSLDYPSYAPAAWMNERATSAIERLDANESGRQKIIDLYKEQLSNLDGIDIPHAALAGATQPLLRFPLLARDTAQSERLIAVVRSAGGYAERWYRPELFPGVTDEKAYGLSDLDRSQVPIHEDVVRRCLCLPTELGIETAQHVCNAIIQTVSHTAGAVNA